jgi:hypothetical protein
MVGQDASARGAPCRHALGRDYFWPHSRAALRQIGLSERNANARRVDQPSLNYMKLQTVFSVEGCFV